jgi:hypothetical protein
MIDAKLLREDGILLVSPVGKLQPEDFEELRLLVNPYIEEHGTLDGLLIDAEHFPGWASFSGLLSHLRFVHDYETKIKRVAAVTDSGFLAILPNVTKHFVAADVRHFEYHDRDKALQWLSAD